MSKDILEIARRALSNIQENSSKTIIEPKRIDERNETNESTFARHHQLYVGWVKFRVFGWLRVVPPRPKWFAREDLAEYLAAYGEIVLHSKIEFDSCRAPGMCQFQRG